MPLPENAAPFIVPQALYAPLQLGALTLPNRIVMAPMTRSLSPGGVPGEDVAAYYRRRAEGGAGLIITEGTWVAHAGASNDAGAPDFHGEAALKGWRNVVSQVHEAGGHIMPQLWHAGLIRKQPSLAHPEGEAAEPRQMGPSGVTGGHGWPIEPDRAPMTLADIDAVIEAFVSAAVSAQALGFDGVELHGAHGYLIDQFLWHKTNRRADRYGGDHAARATFAAEIVAEIRRRVGPGFPLIFRCSQWKSHDYDARLAETPDELAALFAPIAAAGVTLFDCSQRRFWEPAFAGDGRNLAGWIKHVTGKPTMTVGSVGLDIDFMTSLFVKGINLKATGFDDLMRMFDRGDFDLVAVGRAILADPHWPNKIRDARQSEIDMFTAHALKTLA